jgi:uncharacterized OsmC-like protein
MAITTLKLSGKIEKTFATEIKTSSHTFIIDQPKAAGGNDEGPNPLEIFLSSIAGCICAIGQIIARQERLEINSIYVDVTGELDKDFLMGKTEEGRAGFTKITANVDIDGNLNYEQKKELLEKIEKRCPIADNIAKSSELHCIVK